MTPAALIHEAQRYGARFRVNGERLRVEAPAPLPDALVTELRAHKPELLALLSANDAGPSNVGDNWTLADQLEAWAERAAILECDGGLSRADAEREAWRLVMGTVH